jgi:hypothetical protein
MSGLLWKLNRLRAMSGWEVPHRAFRWLGQKIEKAALSGGWAPAPAHPVKPKLSLFLPQENWLTAWQQYYALEQAPLDDLLQGKIGFFGHAPLDVGVPVNWHRDPLTGIEAPLSFGKELNYRDDKLVGNVKILWELGRHQHLIPLAAAYACTGELRYRDAVVAQIEGWIDANPYGLGIHWCSALEPALRLISWAVVHSLLVLRDGGNGLFSAVANPSKLGRAIYQHAWFVRHFLSRHSSANNHLIGELTGLWVACCVFELGKQGEAWAETAQKELEREAQLQVYPDGVDKEQACYYHLWVLEYFLFTWIVGLRSERKFSAAFSERILAMSGFLRAITPARGEPPQIGDADDGFVTRFNVAWPEHAYRDVLAAVETVFAIKIPASPLPQKAFWYAFCLGNIPKAGEQISTTGNTYPALFRDGGYAVLGRRAVHAVFDAGPLGYPSIAAHGHADALNVCLALDGAWWLVDPGTYAYHTEHGWRDYFRGTAAHNTVQMDGRNQSEMGGPFLWLRHAHARLIDAGMDAPGVQWAVGEHDGYDKLGGRHTRRIELGTTGDEFTISDDVQGSGGHELAIHFHFAPDIDLAPGPQGGTWRITRAGTERRIEMLVDDTWHWEVFRGSESPRLGWFSPALGTKVPSSTLRGVWRGRLPIRLVTRMIIR